LSERAATERIIEEWTGAGRVLDTPGAATRVWERGAGEPVVCLHGVPASSFLYRKLLPELEQRGLRGVAFDFPGLGLAERPAAFDYSWSGLSRWTSSALDALGLDRVHLVVHDIGGPIGFDVIASAPGRIASLTVLNTLTRSASFKRPWTMEPFARRGIGELYVRSLHPIVFERLMRIQGVATPVPAAELRAYVPLLKGTDGGRAFLRIMRGFERTAEFESRTVAALRSREFPAALAWGRDDPALRIEDKGEQAREVLGLEEIVPLPGKHFVQEDSPAAIADVVQGVAGQSGA
jgi:pimeloyl-ACP methyl ester carboxylesterase